MQIYTYYGVGELGIDPSSAYSIMDVWNVLMLRGKQSIVYITTPTDGMLNDEWHSGTDYPSTGFYVIEYLASARGRITFKVKDKDGSNHGSRNDAIMYLKTDGLPSMKWFINGISPKNEAYFYDVPYNSTYVEPLAGTASNIQVTIQNDMVILYLSFNIIATPPSNVTLFTLPSYGVCYYQRLHINVTQNTTGKSHSLYASRGSRNITTSHSMSTGVWYGTISYPQRMY